MLDLSSLGGIHGFARKTGGSSLKTRSSGFVELTPPPLPPSVEVFVTTFGVFCIINFFQASHHHLSHFSCTVLA